MMTDRPRPIRSSKGFTLIELMLATTLSVILGAVLIQLVVHTQRMADIMISSTQLNQSARAQFRMMADGGVFIEDNNAETRVDWFRGNESDPVDGVTADGLTNTSELNELRLILNRANANNTETLLLASQRYQDLAIVCQADDVPLLTCDAAGENLTLSGNIDLWITTSQQDAAGAEANDDLTLECQGRECVPGVTWTVIAPHWVPRVEATTTLLQREYSRQFWTAFTQHVDM